MNRGCISCEEISDDNKYELYVETVKNVKLARAYIPYQQWETIYPPEEGLKKGTVFPSLYDPHF